MWIWKLLKLRLNNAAAESCGWQNSKHQWRQGFSFEALEEEEKVTESEEEYHSEEGMTD